MDTKKLRQKILDLAICGKLVPQDTNDEPAFELLKRINPKFEASENEQYDIVPLNWALAKVEDFGDLLSGRDLANEVCNNESKGIPYLIGASNIEGNTFSFVRWTEHPQVVSIYGDMLITCKGTIGTVIKNNIGKMHIARQFMAIRPKDNCISSDYLRICLLALIEKIKKDARGVIPGISRDDILEKTFPLPPFAEQKRIVTAIEQWFALIDILENEKSDLQASIQQAKSKILDLAIHGKLVPQDPNDEPAIDLLKRINPEFEPCDEEDCPHEVPEGWTFFYLQDVFKITMGSSPVGESLNRIGEGIEFHQGKLCFSELYIGISDVYSTEPIKIADPASLLLCVRAPVGIVNICNREICIGRGLCALTPLQGLDLRYGFYALQTCQQDFEQKATGSTFKAISGDVVKKQIIPLPPYQEQLRIVAKIEELFAILDSIKESLE